MLTAVSPILAAYIEVDVARPQYHLSIVALGLVAIMTNITAVWRIRYVMAELRRIAQNAPHGAVK